MGRNQKKIGNKFQEDFFKSVPSNLYCERYKDAPTKFRAVNNPADFFLNTGYCLLQIECKTSKDNSFPLGNISMEQVWKMLCNTCKLNTHGGFLINFRKHNETYFVFVSDFIHWYLNRDRASIPIDWLKDHGYKVSQKLLRTRWRYGIQGLLDWIKEVKYNVN